MGFTFRALAAVVGVSVGAAMFGCATGEATDSFGAITFGDADDDDGATTTGEAPGGKTGPAADETGFPGVDIDVASTGAVDETGTTGGPDGTDSGDGGPGDESSTGSEPPDEPPPPPVDWYEPCDETTPCVGGVCVRLEDEGVLLGSYCTSLCVDAQSDCEVPGSGNADPLCLVISPHVVCGLECTGGQSCPAGMSCFAFASGDYCF